MREHQDLVFISQNGMVQRTGVRGINRYGRTSQGVRVMNLREGDVVSAVALVIENESPTAAAVTGDELPLEPLAEGSRTAVEEAVDESRGHRRDPAGSRGRRVSAGCPPHGSLLFESPEKGGGPKLSDSFGGTLEVPGR